MNEQLNLSQQVCFPIYAFTKEIINQYRPLLDAIELTYPQYLVMMVLWEHDSQTVNQLGGKLHLDSGTLTPLLKRLETKSLVSRTRSSIDERIVNITLTMKGKELQKQAATIPQQLMQAMNLEMADLEELKRIITKISNKNK